MLTYYWLTFLVRFKEKVSTLKVNIIGLQTDILVKIVEMVCTLQVKMKGIMSFSLDSVILQSIPRNIRSPS